MALHAPARPQAPVAARAAHPAGADRRLARLRTVDARQLHPVTQRRRARLVAFAAASILGSALLFIVVGQTLVASQQVRLDTVQQELSSAVAENENLQLQRAELDSPTRILDLAEHRLGMVTPAQVTYLVPVDPYRTVPQGTAGASHR